jgi:hypothetical protein
MDTRPQLEREAFGALVGAGLLILGSALLGAGLAGAAVAWLTTPKKP